MDFPAPIPFTEALDKLAQREVTPSMLDSHLWSLVPTAIRERAFFSSRVESARVLQSMKDYTSEYLSNSRFAPTSHDTGALVASGRSEFVADMRELAISEGLGHVDPLTGQIEPHIRESDLTDIRSISRLQLIFDTQTEAAQEHGYWKQGQDADILDVFPCQRFIRVRPVKKPRGYHDAALGEVRRKDDLKFWVNLNHDFNVPWGPWGYNSGCGVEDVDRVEAEALGIIPKNAVVIPVEKQFNEGLQASVRNLDPGIAAALARSTGGTLAGGVIVPPAAVPVPLPISALPELPAAPIWPKIFSNVREAVARWKSDFGVVDVLSKAPSNPRTWGAKMTIKDQIAHLHTVGAEFSRLVEQYPSLQGKLHTFLNIRSPRGRAHLDGPNPYMSTKSKEWSDAIWKNQSAWNATHGMLAGIERQGSQVVDNFRHELAHTLSTPGFMAEWKSKTSHLDLAWFRQHVSFYAGTNDMEAVAESFCLFTRKDYQLGTLPDVIEQLFTQILA